tara:strand:+ start:1892 stop:2065 length:174 start_codon:yes stop_codon:yes gene_type:complete
LLTTKDHWACGIFALLIWMSLKLALTPTLLSFFGWAMLFWNWQSFLHYCEKRKRDKS